MTVLAHLAAAERQAAEMGKALPERFRKAQAARAKVYDIGGAAPMARERGGEDGAQKLFFQRGLDVMGSFYASHWNIGHSASRHPNPSWRNHWSRSL